MLGSPPCSPKILTKSAGMPKGGLSYHDRGISKELKAAQKKVWPTFPFQVGMFSLQDFSHSKVEVAALEDVKVDIEFKSHDPHKIVEAHLAQHNLRKCVHEISPQEVFRGVRSYEEVLSRV